MAKFDVNQVPKPLAAAAGAGDLAVEKIRDLSKRAADKLSSMEADPSAFADKVQENIEHRAETLGTAFRSAGDTVRTQAQGLSEKAQAVLYTAFEQAGEAYETLAKRGEDVVVRLSGEGHQIEARDGAKSTPKETGEAAEKEKTKTQAKSAAKPSAAKPAGTKSGSAKTTAKTGTARKTARSSSGNG